MAPASFGALLFKGGAIVDVTILAASSSTRTGILE
jgi:hypothetical protein